MPADHYITDTDMTKVADAIRAKAGTTDPLVFPDGMKNAINSITSGSFMNCICFEPVYDYTLDGSVRMANIEMSNNIFGYNDDMKTYYDPVNPAHKLAFFGFRNSWGSESGRKTIKVSAMYLNGRLYDKLKNTIPEGKIRPYQYHPGNHNNMLSSEGITKHDGELYININFFGVVTNSDVEIRSEPIFFVPHMTEMYDHTFDPSKDIRIYPR